MYWGVESSFDTFREQMDLRFRTLRQIFARTLRGAERGVALIEAAIAIPTSILLIVLLIDTGQMMHTHHVLSQIVNDSLVYAATLNNVNVAPSVNPIDNTTTNLLKLQAHAQTLISLDSTLRISGAPVITPAYNSAQDTISLSVNATYAALFPFFQDRVIAVQGEAGYMY